MRKVYLIVLTIIIGIVINSCESTTYSDIAGEVANPTYNANVKGIIDDNCVRCHNSNDSQRTDLETYIQVKAACDAIENNNLICRIKGNSCGDMMPATALPATYIKIIEDWKSQNYPEN
jgi:hypothetical protein